MNSMRNPMKHATGLGSAKHGVAHFMIQRITAVALVLLSIWFMVLVLGLLGSDYATARAAVAQPFNAILMIAFLIAAFWHAQLGLQVVIEDYVHTPWIEMALQIIIKLACALAVVAGVLAVLRITLGS